MQDCVALARAQGEPEWQVYFHLQLTGGSGASIDAGDPKKFKWQPASRFAVGTCYARNATNPSGMYWVAILLY